MRCSGNKLSLLFLQLLLHDNIISTAQLLPVPNVRWTYTLSGSSGNGAGGRSLRAGNAVQAYKSMVLATAEDGSLHILNPESLDTSIVFEPPPVTGKYTECRSGIATVEEDGEEYLVYAVIDALAPSSSGVGLQGFDGGDASSRLLAVNLDGSLRWSLDMDGIVVGTPLVGFNSTVIYVSQNVNGTNGLQGHITVISPMNSAANVTASLKSDFSSAPFGPPSITTVQNFDIVAVAESGDDGYSTHGAVYLLLPFSGPPGKHAKYTLVLASALPFSSVTPPTLSASGLSMWVGGEGSNIAGWTGNRGLGGVVTLQQVNANPLWSTVIPPNPQNISMRKFLSRSFKSNLEFSHCR